MHLADTFFKVYAFTFNQILLSLGIEPMTFALLAVLYCLISMFNI